MRIIFTVGCKLKTYNYNDNSFSYKDFYESQHVDVEMVEMPYENVHDPDSVAIKFNDGVIAFGVSQKWFKEVEVLSGILVEVYRTACDWNKGFICSFSDDVDRFLLILPEGGDVVDNGDYRTVKTANSEKLTTATVDRGKLIAVKYDIDFSRSVPAYSGNFIYSDDSKFPSLQPIPI